MYTFNSCLDHTSGENTDRKLEVICQDMREIPDPDFHVGGDVQRREQKLGASLRLPLSKQQSLWTEYKLYLSP